MAARAAARPLSERASSPCTIPHRRGSRKSVAGPGATPPARALRRSGFCFPLAADDQDESYSGGGRVRRGVVLVTKTIPESQFALADLGDRRVLTIGGREYVTRYSARVIRMLIERKGVARTPPYLTYRETRGPHFLGPLVRRLRTRGARDLRVLEVGCSFGHMTEYLAEQPEVGSIVTFDT